MHTGTWTTYISTFAFPWLDTVKNHGTAKVWMANIVTAICNIPQGESTITKTMPLQGQKRCIILMFALSQI